MDFRYNAYQIGFDHALKGRPCFNPFVPGTRDFRDYLFGYNHGINFPVQGSM